MPAFVFAPHHLLGATATDSTFLPSCPNRPFRLRPPPPRKVFTPSLCANVDDENPSESSTTEPSSSSSPPSEEGVGEGTMQANMNISLDEEVSNQFVQHENRDRDMMAREKVYVEQLPVRERHVHIFMRMSSIGMFTAAANNYINSLLLSSAPAQTKEDKRLWIIKSVEDVTFGELRGPPTPARMVVISRMAQSEGTMKWVNALDRTGPAFSPMENHYVDWALSSTETPEKDGNLKIEKGFFVASEIINANWTKKAAISSMRDILHRHAEKAVKGKFALSFQVLQSVDEPSCFKTVEVYKQVDDLKDCLSQLGESFQSQTKVYRAAVYRVRQLYECVAQM